MTLGKLVSFSEYLSESSSNDQPRELSANQVVAPYLQQAVEKRQANPIGCWVEYWRASNQLSTAQTLATFAAVVARSEVASIRALIGSIEAAANEVAATMNGQIPLPLKSAASELYQRASFIVANEVADAAGNSATIVFNANSRPSRSHVRLGQPSESAAIYAQSPRDHMWDTVVDVPGCGFAIMNKIAEPAAAGTHACLAIEDESHVLLRTEFLEARIDRATGSLSSLHDFTTRGNRLSQRLVARSGTSESVEMIADDVRIEHATTMVGSVRAQGRLTSPSSDSLARFDQTFTVHKGSRVVDVDLTLRDVQELDHQPWTHYFGVRSAWSKDAAKLYRCVNEHRSLTTGKRFESPLFVEIESGERRTALLTMGLPFHVRSSERSVDTLLRVAGETTTRFQFGIGVDLPLPMMEATRRLSPPLPVACSLRKGKNATTGWLFHVDSKRVMANDWRPVFDSEQPDSPASRVRFSLAELSGRSAKVSIRAFRRIKEASQIDIDGSKRAEYEVADGEIRVSLAAHEWTEVEARW